jgi:hypothetical protein
MNTIKLNEKEIDYTLKISQKTRRMRLAIYCDGNFVVTVPKSMSNNLIEQFIIKKSKWIISKLDYFKNIPSQVFVKNNKGDYVKYKKQALDLVKKRIEYFNSIYGFKFNNIRIKNQKTRWGSCSKKRNINFNYKIVMLPEKLADYIIIHELCHLKEFNHSKKFWSLVNEIMPNYLEIRKELKNSRLG